MLGGLALGASAGAAALVDGPRSHAAGAPRTADGSDRRVPFHGIHQQGVLAGEQAAGAVVAFDTTAANRAELVDLFRTVTEQARFLTRGGTPEDLGITAPPADNGIVGPVVSADGLTMTLSVGASLFDDRYGLAASKPARLTTMSAEPFPNDALVPSSCDGDLLVQLSAGHPDTVLHALRQVMKVTRGGMQIRWRQDGFRPPPRPTGTPRNLLGFKDGTANLDTGDAALMNQLVWTRGGAGGEPPWTTNGTYHVVRVIRMLVEFWDRVNLREQENMIGRRKDTGAPNTGGGEFSDPDFVNDPNGDSIPFTAHIRLANPRVPETEDSRILRRSFNYDNGTDVNGQLQQGLVFIAFNQDLERQFKAIQTRLTDEPLVDYVQPFGGGYFFALPGVRDRSDWLGSGLLT